MKKRTGIMMVCLVVLLCLTAAVYAGIGMHYQTHFFAGTTINGIQVSDMTAGEAEKLIARQAEDYTLTVTAKDGSKERIAGEEIGYRFVSGGEAESFLKRQNFLAWLPNYFGEKTEYTMQAAVTFDEELLRERTKRLSCMQEDQVTKPADAFVEQRDGGYVIVPEVEGNELDAAKVYKVLKNAVKTGAASVDFTAEQCYVMPKVRADDGALKAELAVWNRYSSLNVTYDMGGGVTETLDAATIAAWFSLDENKQPVFDRSAVAAWVNQLADKYDTIGTWPPFTTSNGETVYVEARTYGWQMDREAETEALYQLLLLGESAQRSPVWLEGARTRGANDLGTTYVEIDYTNQRLWYYKDGALLVETPVVTGNVGAGMASPEGIFCLVGKSEDEILKGEGYATPVEYWMPFYGGVGIHDADSWRGTYGGDIYRWGGSHGCINTPTAQVAVLYQNIEVGTPIICYSSEIDYGYGQVSVSGGASGSTGANTSGGDASASGNGRDGSAAGNGTGDIVIIDGGGSSPDTQTQETTADGTAYVGEDLQDVIIE